MSTTTTIYPSGDANLRENAPDTNYSGNSVIRVGQYTGHRRHGVFMFDVSSVTADIVSATISFTYSGGYGTPRTMKLARLNQNFVESEVTWNSASSGVAWTGGAGGEDNGEFSQPVYDISVGSGLSGATAEIRDLVRDAVARRENLLWLVLCFDPDDTSTANARSYIYPVEDTTEANRPKLTITTASRVVWTNRDEDNDADNDDNWSTGTVPDGGDYVLFNSGSESVTAGSISCHSLFVGRKYGGDIQEANGDPIQLNASTTGTGHIIRVQNRRGIVNLMITSARDMYIDTPSASTCKIKHALLATPYNVTVARTGGDWQFTGDSNIVATSSQSKRLTLDGTATDIVAAQSTNLTLSNGCNDLTLIKSVATCTEGDIAGSVKIAAGAELTIQSEDNSGTIDVYNGSATLKNNENAGIDTGAVTVWPRGKFDARTGTGAWTPTADPAIISRGGRFELDQGVNLAPS